MDSQALSFKILMFPWLAHGHIFPYLELSKNLSIRKNVKVYLCSTAINFSSIQNFIQTNELDHCIELVEIHLEPSSQLPPHNHTTKNLPSHLIFPLLKAFQTAKSSFTRVISTLKPDLVVYDVFQPWAAILASSHGIPAVHFYVAGAASQSYGHNEFTCRNDNFPFPELDIKDDEKESMRNVIEFVRPIIFDGGKEAFFVNYTLSCELVLIKSSRVFEGKYIDYFSGVCNKKILPVGPLVTDPTDDENSEILEWLGKKNHHSTVYISFGSEYFLSKEEIEEISKALELCEVNFIWVIRFPHGENTITIEEALPEGFLDRVQERGRVVTGWAPQTKILKHPSTGAFASHCGWSSIMESMYFGVPVIGMPLKINMFVDANLLVHVGACVKVPRKENERYKAEDIAKTIDEAIVGKSGDVVRHRTQELSEKMRMEEVQEMDAVADHLWKICLKKGGGT